MKVSYVIPGISMQTKARLVADLTGYRLQRDLHAEKKLKALSDNSKWMGKVVDVAKKNSGAPGMTIDTVLQGLNTALSMDIFSFRVNGVDVFKSYQEHLTPEPMVLEIEMNELYFSSEIAMEQAIRPGFRKDVTTEYIEGRMERAKRKWLFEFEANVKEYFNAKAVAKKLY